MSSATRLLGSFGPAVASDEAMAGVSVEQAEGDHVGCGQGRADLGQEVDAVAGPHEHLPATENLRASKGSSAITVSSHAPYRSRMTP